MPFVSYAQNGEDLVLWRALKGVENGFYIDVGAADPKVDSVTHAFYERGWNGINIEPTPEYFGKIAAERTRDVNLNALIGDVPGTVTFYKFASLGLSTMNEGIAQRHIDAGLDYETLSMPVLTLTGVCQSHGAQPIHFLKIDVEGAERQVLQSMDFTQYRPWILVIEATEPMKQISTRSQWEDLVLQSDYLFAYYDGLNCYYVASEQKHLIQVLEVPPSIFDDFIKANEFEFRAQAEAWRLRLIEVSQDADTWRQNLEKIREEAEGWRRHLVELSRNESAWHAEMARKDATAAALAEQLAAAHRDYRALEATHAQSIAHIEELRRIVGHRDSVIADHQHHLSVAHGQLHEVWSSFSWRATIPLRSLSARLPGLAQGLRGVAYRHPRLRRVSVRMVRSAGRMLLLKSPIIRAPTRIQEPAPQVSLEPLPPAIEFAAISADTAPASPAPASFVMRRPRHWFYLGDTIQWLEDYAQLSGVGKVTVEIFLASLNARFAEPPLPCALAPTETGLASVSLHDTVGYLGARLGLDRSTAATDALVLDRLPPAVAFSPAAGDHVLFTGVVWAPSYSALFTSLNQRGVAFSVLVYDIIPLINPEFVDTGFREIFAAWLRIVLTQAQHVFVSGATVRDQILRWATLSDISVSATVVAVEFGMNVPLLASDVVDAGEGPLSLVRRENFVLSVGTIDRRKNQSMLCRIWPRLIAELGREAVPQLVLVGRDDLDMKTYAPAQAALAAGDIVVLQGVSDADLAQLYRTCRFTVFPSLSEGYGLPVSESLAFGKLCVSSDLAVIREHAGDMPWYFPPDDEEAALTALRRAITDPAAVQTTEARIIADYTPRAWTSTYATIAESIGTVGGSVPLEQYGRLFIPGIPAPELLPTLRLAETWCTEDDPQVSILIVNWNAYRLTRACVQHIWANTTDVRYEIIIADNGSSPAECLALNALGRGVRFLKLGENRFFGEACNIAAEHARAPLLCLLNNDCFGQPGWLKILVEALEADPSAGAAGPLFLFPDMRVQEAGGTIDEHGFPVRFGRGEPLRLDLSLDYLQPRSVDYISAASLVVRRDAYLRAGGFDLGYEPAYYEDADLCFKLKALGLSVRCCPSARAIHIEGAAANDDPVAEGRRKALGDLNRGKFVSRWGTYLRTRDESDLIAIKRQIFIDVPAAPRSQSALPTAVLFTPYALTPGGGERFLLTIASELMRDHQVSVVTPNPYSMLRLQNIGHAVGIDLSRCRTQSEGEYLAGPAPDLMVVVGNYIYPPITPRTPNAVFICQFPFPMSDEKRVDHGYRAVIAYSDYARAHIVAGLSAYQMPRWPVEVVYPPVPQIRADGAAKRPIVLTVGRFFAGGHNKRHDLMIEAFRRLHKTFDGEVEMHLAGSSTPAPQHMQYLESLIQAAEGLPVTFHVNASQETLEDLYRRASIYWHATGLGADLARQPEVAEHFGISLVEAMAGQCVPMAFNAGGPREIITHGLDGFLYASTEELVALTAEILHPESTARRDAIGRAAGERARMFAPERFGERVRQVLMVP